MSLPGLVVLGTLAAGALLGSFARPDRHGWGWFGAWALAGALGAFSALSFALGLVTTPFAVAAILALSVTAWGREALGFAAGAGATVAFVGAVNADHRAWLALGAAATLAAAAAYALTRRP